MSEAIKRLLGELNDNQQIAARSDGHVIVTAGAGTGKTRVLTARVLMALSPERLADHGTDPQAIHRLVSSLLVVTFTRKATAEMRERIISTLHRFREETQGEERKHWQRVLQNVDSLEISTIDSMTHRIMARLDGGAGTISSIRERLEDERLEEDVYSLIVETYQGFQDPGYVEELRRAGVESPEGFTDGLRQVLRWIPSDAISDIVKKLYKSPRSSFSVNAPPESLHELYRMVLMRALETVVNPVKRLVDVHYEGLRKVIDYYIDGGSSSSERTKAKRTDYSEALQYLHSHTCDEIVADIVQDGKAAGYIASLNKMGSAFRKAGKKGELSSKWVEAIRSAGWDPYSLTPFEVYGEYWNPTIWKEREFESFRAQFPDMFASDEQFVAFRYMVGEGSLLARPDMVHTVVSVVYSLLRLFHHRRMKQREEEGIIQQDEMVRHLFSRLEADPGLSERLYPNLTDILVDEFQDTNTVQWRVIMALARGRNGHSRARIFVVGDVKQAIYGFRGGEVQVFSVAAEDLAQDPMSLERVFLDVNYRSRPGIISLGNRLAQSMGYGDAQARYPGGGDGFPGIVHWSQVNVKSFYEHAGNVFTRRSDKFIEVLESSPDAKERLERMLGSWDEVLRTLQWFDRRLKELKFSVSNKTGISVVEGLVAEYLDAIRRDDRARLEELAGPRIVETPVYDVLRSAWKQGRPVVGILYKTRKRNYRAMKEELAARDVPFVAIGEQDLFSMPHIVISVLVLGLLVKPYSRTWLAAVLMSPLVGLSLREFTAISAAYLKYVSSHEQKKYTDRVHLLDAFVLSGDGADPEWWQVAGLSDTMTERLRAFARLMGSLRDLMQRRHPSYVLAVYMADPLVWSGVWDVPESQMRADLGLLMGMLSQETSVSWEKLILSLVSMVEQTPSERRADVPYYESAPVQIFTEHGSKGLEFPLVILPSMDSGMKSGRGYADRAWCMSVSPFALHPDILDRAFGLGSSWGPVDPPEIIWGRMLIPRGETGSLQKGMTSDMIYLRYLHEQYEMDEQIRLMYVAATRARDVLWLLGVSGATKRKNRSGEESRIVELSKRLGFDISSEDAASPASSSRVIGRPEDFSQWKSRVIAELSQKKNAGMTDRAMIPRMKAILEVIAGLAEEPLMYSKMDGFFEMEFPQGYDGPQAPVFSLEDISFTTEEKDGT